MKKTIPYARQTVAPADLEAVVRVLESDWLTQGPAVARFEEAVAAYCGVRYAVAVSSGTAALHIAALAAGLGPGKRLWTSPNTFVASANCARYCGADVDFVDIDLNDGNMSVSSLEAKLRQARSLGQLPDVVVPVHFAGHSCDMVGIGALAREYGFSVIEDAAHAFGGTYRNQAVGSCAYSDMAIFSFHPVKSITTAEGGMIVTNSEALYDRLALLRTHGITRDSRHMVDPSDGPWDYEQVDLGFNYRLSDVHAALGLSQMQHVDEFIERRRYLAQFYDDALAGLPLHPLVRREDTRSAFHLYPVRIPEGTGIRNRRAVFDGLRAAGIAPQVHYIPVHTQPYYQRCGFARGDFPVAERFYAEELSLPMFPALTEAEQSYVIEQLGKLLE